MPVSEMDDIVEGSMIFQIGLENNVEGRSLAWALEHPGCFAYGITGETALNSIPDTIMEYSNWISSNNNGDSWVELSDIRLKLADTWEVFSVDEDYNVTEQGYEVNAWFRYDWKPLSALEVERGLKLLSWTREDLLGSVAGLSQHDLEVKHPGERWDIAGILNHVGGAEWWYLDRLGLAFPRAQVPEDPFERLIAVRRYLVDVLSSLVGSTLVLGAYAEFWSPRKLLRRAIWHERDHTIHIHKLR
jgi:hypothetical protein